MKCFDIIIPIAKNDVGALKNSLPYIIKHLPSGTIKIIASKEIKNAFDNCFDIQFIDENSMIKGVDLASVKTWINNRYPKAIRRTGWYFQQFLKLGYAKICDKEYYLSWDSDTIPLTELTFFDANEKPYFDVLPLVKEDAAYGDTIDKLWTDKSVKGNRDFSFITEHMLFKTDVVNEMLNEIEENQMLEGANFAEKIINSVPIKELNLSGFSEFETYAAYTKCRYPDEYTIRMWKNLRHGKAYFGTKVTSQQMEWVSHDFDVISIEDFDQQLVICKLMCNKNNINKQSFLNVYKYIEPIIRFKYMIRMKLRKIIRK